MPRPEILHVIEKSPTDLLLAGCALLFGVVGAFDLGF
jgi:hypothetical protein